MPVSLEAVDLPAKPGIYLFKNERGRVLYVGKATSLKERIKSYFSTKPDRIMIPELVRQSENVEYIVTNSPNDALILERQLIREHKPKYNSRLKDDKSFPYIALTNEEYPRIIYSRHPPKDCRKWGPFPKPGAAKKVIQVLRSQFGIRDKDCRGNEGCLSMHIGLCKGPCVDPEGYDKIVKLVTNVLDGEASLLIEELVNEMDQYSKEQDFEFAAKLRDMIVAVRTVTSQQMISSTVYRDCDCIGFAEKGDMAAIVVLHADQGIIQGQEAWPLIHRGDIGDSIAIFVSEHYSNRLPPRLLLTPTPLPETVIHWLTTKRGSNVENRVAKRGDLATLSTLAKQNAEMQIENMFKSITCIWICNFYCIITTVNLMIR